MDKLAQDFSDFPPIEGDEDDPLDEPRFFGCGSEFKAGYGECLINWEPLENIATTEKEFRVCYISEVRSDPSQLPSFQHPETMEEMHFDSSISQPNFEGLLAPLQNLKLMEIHISTLQHLFFTKNEKHPHVDLPNLECLEISSTNFAPWHVIPSTFGNILDNISTLLTNPYNFPKLTYLSVSSPTYPPMDEDFTRSILKSIAIHKDTLKYFNFEAEFAILQDLDGKYYAESLYDETDWNKEANMALITAAASATLISLHFYSLVKTASSEIWRKFMESQQNLEYFQFWCEELYLPFPTGFLDKNFNTLHTVAINIDVPSAPHPPAVETPTTPPLDLAIFKKCPVLKVLYLKGNSASHSDPVCLPALADVINAQELPSSLLFAKILNILVSKEDATSFVKLPNLRILNFTDIGEDGNFGLPFAELASFLHRDTFKRVEVVRSISRESVLEKSDSGFEAMAKVLFAKQICSSFRVRKNLDNVLEPLTDDEEDSDDEEGENEFEDDDEDEPSSLATVVENPCVQVDPCAQVCADNNMNPDSVVTNSVMSLVNPSIGNNANDNENNSVLVTDPSKIKSSYAEVTAETPSNESAEAELDPDEANLDTFVKDFDNYREPPS